MAKGDSLTRTQTAQTLLIVDDERSLRFSLGEWARDEGFTPIEAPGGRKRSPPFATRGSTRCCSISSSATKTA